MGIEMQCPVLPGSLWLSAHSQGCVMTGVLAQEQPPLILDLVLWFGHLYRNTHGAEGEESRSSWESKSKCKVKKPLFMGRIG